MKWMVVILGILLLVGSVSAATILGVSSYPPANNYTYVNATSTTSGYEPYHATNSSKSLTGTHDLTSWVSAVGGNTNQRFHIDLGSAKQINRIYYENFHSVGSSTDYGVKNFTFWGSNSSTAFLNKTYTNDTGWTSLPADITTLIQHTSSDVSDPKYVVVTNNGSYRYYGFKFANNYNSSLTQMAIRRIELQREISWVYSTPGTFYWVCPANVTTVSLNLGVGGGSGKGAYIWYGNYYIGYGGSSGEWQNHATIATTPGTNYTIVVGAGGVASAVDAVSNAGGLSSAFTFTSAGGAGGLSSPGATNANGGAGSNGFLTGGNANAGGSVTSYSGGLAGSGYGAGGGGGAARTSPAEAGVGGKGSDGYVGIFQTGYSTFNTPDFSGTPLSGVAGTLVSFTDESLILDNSNITYLWDFGDDSTSTTIGDIVHVFPYVGSYTVSLTINTDLGSVTEEKEAYINLVSEVPQLDLKTEPNPVQFTIVDKYGRYLKNVAATAKMTSTSTNGTNWLTTLFGISPDATSVNETTMYDVAGDDGAVVFPLVSAALYHITFTNASQGVSDAKDIHPVQANYIYILGSTATAVPANNTAINITLWTYPPASTNPATVYLIANYTDSTATTSNVTFFVNFSSNQTIKYTHSHTSSPMDEQYGVTNTAGVGYTWAVRSTSTTFGNVSKAMGLTLKGTGQYGLASNLLSVCNNWECT
jgi:PKD repeat protein